MWRRVALLGAVILLGTAGMAVSAEPAKLDFNAFQRIPVFDHGRIMPMDTYARKVVERITNSQNPRLAQTPMEESSDAKDPDDATKRYTAVEILLSWLVEPQRWENVPFIYAPDETVRGDYLEVAVKDKDGHNLKYVTPREVEQAEKLQEKLVELRQKQRQAEADGVDYKPVGIDKKVGELFQAYALYRQLTFDPVLDPTARGKFQSHLGQLDRVWGEMRESLQMFLERGQQAGEQAGISGSIVRADQAAQQLAELSQLGRFKLEDAEKVAAEFAASTAAIAEQFGAYQKRLSDNPPPQWDADQVRKLKTLLGHLAWQTKQLAEEADALHGSLYENAETLRVVPALNAAALDRDRDPMDESQPWLDLQTLILGSPRALRGYPTAEVEAVRQSFFRMAEAYMDRPQRPNDFRKFEEQFAADLRKLAQGIEPAREKLPIKNRDEELIAYTQYPAVGQTDNELRYNELDPFKWSWMISLASALCFGPVFIFGMAYPNLRKRMFWLGLALLLGGLVWTAYGFYLRVSVTRWAPVTNMYETVIYVPFFVSMLGAWFALLPIMWPGVRNAWRMTALLGTWESKPLDEEQLQLCSPARWKAAQLALLLPRVALSALVFCVLSVFPYAAGDRTIINLLPVTDLGAKLPDMNNLLTWIVGLFVLVPTVWYLPRVILTCILSLIVVPLTDRSATARQWFSQIYDRWPFGLAATAVAFFGAYIAWYSPVLDKSFTPLTPVLRDNFWLLIHVLTIVSSYGAGALAWGLGCIGLAYYLFGKYRTVAPAVAGAAAVRRPPEQCAQLAGFTYKAVQVAVLLLAAGTILGALWADVAWGRFWGWDPKEVWALISLLVYVAILHGRFAGWVGNFGLTAGTVMGATAIIMSWYGVNFVLGQGLHSYGFGEGSTANWYVLAAVQVNWGFLMAAGIRYWIETSGGRKRGPRDPGSQGPGSLATQRSPEEEEAPV